MKICHFMYVPFTGLGLHNGYRGDEWLKNRIKIFKQFVVPSLANQTSKNFVLLLSFRPEDKTNPIVQDLVSWLDYLKDIKSGILYEGVMFWDDKYEDTIAADRLYQTLKKSLPQLTEIVGDASEVLFTIQPSDDMYVSNTVEKTQRFFREADKGIQVVGFDKGYIMSYATKEIAEYNPETSPPFYTIRFPKDIFLDPDEHYTYIGPYKSHEYVKDYLKFAHFIGRGFCVGTHGENISTVFEHPYKGRLLEGVERDRVLLDLGIWHKEPLLVKKRGMRLWVRVIANKLPFEKQLRNIYHKLPWRLF